MKRDPVFDLLRWLAVCGVVIFHATFNRYSDHCLGTIFQFEKIFAWCVLCFFQFPVILHDTIRIF